MQTKIEGLLLNKRPFGERHIVGTLLLRNGKLCSVTFYGGKGGGQKKKSSILEMGFMLKVELAKPKRKSGDEDLYQAKEWDLVWHHQNLRHSLHAFHALYFMAEVVSKSGAQVHLEDEGDDEDSAGLFRVLSNAYFYFDKKMSSISESDSLFLSYGVVSLFLAKLLMELGVFPETRHCVLTDQSVEGVPVQFLPDHGGFALREALQGAQASRETHQDDSDILLFLRQVTQCRFQDFSFDSNRDYSHLSRRLFHYFCYQFQFQESQFRTFSLIFS